MILYSSRITTFFIVVMVSIVLLPNQSGRYLLFLHEVTHIGISTSFLFHSGTIFWVFDLVCQTLDQYLRLFQFFQSSLACQFSQICQHPWRISRLVPCVLLLVFLWSLWGLQHLPGDCRKSIWLHVPYACHPFFSRTSLFSI